VRIMAQKDRKIQKKRGDRNNGRGRKGTRKRGGGRGLGGSKKHKKSWIIKYMPDHFGHDKNQLILDILMSTLLRIAPKRSI